MGCSRRFAKAYSTVLTPNHPRSRIVVIVVVAGRRERRGRSTDFLSNFPEVLVNPSLEQHLDRFTQIRDATLIDFRYRDKQTRRRKCLLKTAFHVCSPF